MIDSSHALQLLFSEAIVFFSVFMRDDDSCKTAAELQKLAECIQDHGYSSQTPVSSW